MTLNSIDLFSGIGGLSQGLVESGFKVVASVEIDDYAVKGYKLNHPDTVIFHNDITKIDTNEIKDLLHGEPLHLLAGCPPCQGFSSMRRRNKKANVRDKRNILIMEFLRFVKELNPLTIMLENVPGITNYYKYKDLIRELKSLEYNLNETIVNVKNYGVPQSRRRLVLVGSKLGEIAPEIDQHDVLHVREVISQLPSVEETDDDAHRIYAKNGKRIKEMIEKIPHNGGSRSDVPEYTLKCHKKENVGFNDVYGRLRWDDFSTTITGGCLNPSKGRFLHPEENRCITAREAALLQSFPIDYKIPVDIPKDEIAKLIGNALPPKFSYFQSRHIKEHIESHLGIEE